MDEKFINSNKRPKELNVTDVIDYKTRKLILIISFIAVITLILRLLARLFLHNLAVIIGLFFDSSDVFAILSQLKFAVINPPWTITLLSSMIIIIIFSKIRKAYIRKRHYSVFIWVFITIPVIILTILTSVYFSVVNGIRFDNVLRILFPLVNSGALTGII